MSNLTNSSLRFDKSAIYPELLIIREAVSEIVIGYVNKHLYADGWFWIMGDELSNFFNCSDDAISDLIREYVTRGFDAKAKNAGVLYNENFVRGL